jgi:hypothetical protein
MDKKKAKILTQEKKRKLTASKDEEGRLNKEIGGISGKYSGK